MSVNYSQASISPQVPGLFTYPHVPPHVTACLYQSTSFQCCVVQQPLGPCFQFLFLCSTQLPTLSGLQRLSPLARSLTLFSILKIHNRYEAAQILPIPPRELLGTSLTLTILLSHSDSSTAALSAYFLKLSRAFLFKSLPEAHFLLQVPQLGLISPSIAY